MTSNNPSQQRLNGQKPKSYASATSITQDLSRLVKKVENNMAYWSDFDSYVAQMYINYANKAIQCKDYVMMVQSQDNLEHFLSKMEQNS